MATNNPYGRKIRYEQPILRLTSKEFLSGVAASAHAVGGGIFFKAWGVTAINSPGISDALDNGLLRAGPDLTEIGGADLADSPFVYTKDYTATNASTQTMYIMGFGGHFYQQVSGITTAPPDLRSGTPITSPANGMAIMQPKGGTKYLYYFQQAQIGRWNLSNSSYPTGWTDNWYSSGINTTVQHPAHNYFDTVLFGNGAGVGSLTDNGSGDVAVTPLALNIPADSIVTAIGDDGVYAAIAVTNNSANSLAKARTRIYFWDGSAESWLREYPIDDAYILSVKRVGNAVICQGTKGIYQVSFAGGVKKLLSRRTGLQYSSTSRFQGPQLSGTINQLGYVFGAWLGNEIDAQPPICVATLGSISDGTPSAYQTPILVTGNSSLDIGFIDSEFEPNKIYVGLTNASTPTSNGKLYVYNFGQVTPHATGVTAQTIYIPLPSRYKIHRIDVIFGVPLASGDDFSMSTRLSESDSIIQFGANITYAALGAVRRKSLYAAKPIIVDEQVSFLFNFNAGIPMIKSIEVYGQLMTP